MTALLEVADLTVRLPTHAGVVEAVTGLSYTLERGRTLGVVGESGCGKTVSALAVLGLLDAGAAVTGSVRLDGEELLGVSERRLRRVRGRRVGMVFQDPLAALHPHLPVGRQVAEAYRAHHATSRAQARDRAVRMLDRVGIADAARRADDHPHQLSGGMRQRAMIAMALVNHPDVLLADEPTTALDVTVQAQILDLVRDLQAELGLAVLLVTHDLGVVAEVADRTLVMYAGRAVEQGPTREVLARPLMPYTQALLAAVPQLTGPADGPLRPVPGRPPDLLRPPPGCPFHPRCPRAAEVPGDLCRTLLPRTRTTDAGQAWRCHLDDPETASHARSDEVDHG